ncbi:hypothetical protein M9Y10_039909 [Tritrichomonas musculus]|uniref:Uncharacterized protein n=1 Tax=Tritrichomonas musculus TaxID=1915356 RepID=A0ABR2GQQ8_9EUKA
MMEQENNSEKRLSLSEEIELGLQMYEDEKAGFEQWKSDLNTFLSEDFQKEWHSTDKSVSNDAIKKLSIWQASSVFTYMFRGTWGDMFSKNRTEALNFLKEAKSSAHNINNRLERLIDNVLDAAYTCSGFY